MLFFIYSFHQMVYGNRGLISDRLISQELHIKQQQLKQLKHQRAILEHKILMLKGPEYDWDYVDELARKYFMVGTEHEKLVIIVR